MNTENTALTVRELAPQVFVAGQLSEQSIKAAADRGIRSIINNRPDHEGSEQPLTADLQRVADELGIRLIYQPVISGAMTAADVETFREIYRDVEKPLLIFCRTGARSAQLFAASGVE